MNTTLVTHLRQRAQALREAIVAHRRHLHQHPELSFQEEQTGQYVYQALQAIGIPCTHGIAGHGVVGLIQGREPSRKVVALRADMDALPIQEANDVPYKSRHAGIMHACGHDVHTASLLGAAQLLYETRDRWTGTVKLLFQPGEEKLPGGASMMIAEGALEQPKPSAILGQHVHPPLAAGKVGFRGGMYMASADELFISVKGRGGHGAMPHECIDPILIAAHLITALQQAVSRWADPTQPAVLTLGKIESVGGATNIIPNEVKIQGTLRAMNESWRADTHERLVQLGTQLVASMGGTCDFEVRKGYPFLHNDEALTQAARTAAEAYLGAENVVDLPIRMTAEDFAYYSQAMPGCFYRLGTGNVQRGITSPVHTNTFDIDEDALPVGAGLMAWLAIDALSR